MDVDCGDNAASTVDILTLFVEPWHAVQMAPMFRPHSFSLCRIYEDGPPGVGMRYFTVVPRKTSIVTALLSYEQFRNASTHPLAIHSDCEDPNRTAFFYSFPSRARYLCTLMKDRYDINTAICCSLQNILSTMSTKSEETLIVHAR
jgi:hypothetical protein